MSFQAMRGNKYIELLSTNNKLLMDQWKMHSSVQKEYDALSKTYVYNVGGKSPMAQMILPKDKKKNLRLYFPLLVLQLCFPVKANLLCDIGIKLCNNQRKRITLSSNQKSKQSSSLFTVLPFVIENQNKWIHILVDIEDIVATIWNNLKLKEIDFLSLSGVFRIKRIFLLSRDLINSTEGVFVINYDQLPKQMSLPKNITQHYVYVSSSCNSLEECVEGRNLKNKDDISSSRSSSRSSMNNEQITSPKVNFLTSLDRNITAPNYYTESKNLRKCEIFENSLSLPMPEFSGGIELNTHTKFNNCISPVQMNIRSSLHKSNSYVPKDNGQDIELWIPLSSNDSQEIC